MDERITPQMSIDYYTSLHGIRVEDLGVAPITIVSWSPGVVRSLAEAVGAQPSSLWMYGERNPLYAGQVNGRPVSIVMLPVGAPGTVMLMEELIACGARLFVGLGMAGGGAA